MNNRGENKSMEEKIKIREKPRVLFQMEIIAINQVCG